jgi:hypothetical protein
LVESNFNELFHETFGIQLPKSLDRHRLDMVLCVLHGDKQFDEYGLRRGWPGVSHKDAVLHKQPTSVPAQQRLQARPGVSHEELVAHQQPTSVIAQQHLQAQPGVSVSFRDEETAYLHYNPELNEGIPVLSREKFPTYLEPPPLPAVLPNTGKCEWSWYDNSSCLTFEEGSNSRVLLANFKQANGIVEVCKDDEKFLLEMMERDDITVVSQGLCDDLNPELLCLDHLVGKLGDRLWEHFRQFTAKPNEDGFTLYDEESESITLPVDVFVQYLKLRKKVVVEGAHLQDNERKLSYESSCGKEEVLDVENTVLYMIDLHLKYRLNSLYRELTEKFKLPGILPGGHHCMMNNVRHVDRTHVAYYHSLLSLCSSCIQVADHGKPDMGPNLYVSATGGFTAFHRDGFGGVDSWHYCHQGYNEVVILRRMTEGHNVNALRVLDKSQKESAFSGLYVPPHIEEAVSTWFVLVLKFLEFYLFLTMSSA